MITFSPSHFLQLQSITGHNNTTISEVPDAKFLGVQIDNRSKLEMSYRLDFAKIEYSWFCNQTVILCTKSENLTNGILCLLSFISYGIIFRGDATNICMVLKLRKRVIRIMSGTELNFL